MSLMYLYRLSVDLALDLLAVSKIVFASNIDLMGSYFG